MGNRNRIDQQSRGRNTNNRDYKVDNNVEAKQKWQQERKINKVNILPKNANQVLALRSFEDNLLTVLSGSAGVGKTLLACWWAANQVVDKNYTKIVIGRVHVPLANRTVGHRSGNLLEKLQQFHLPMIEYLSDVFGREAVQLQLEKNTGYIELADLESIRGRSFRQGTIVIIDEAQLLLPEEIQALTTRLGTGSKLILCGDPVQKDVRDDKCGLLYLEHIITKYDIKDCSVVKFTEEDIVRSGITRDFVIAYQKEHFK